MTTLSVVTISYNAQRYLPALLASVRRLKSLAPSSLAVEYVVADGGSEDRSGELLVAARDEGLVDVLVAGPDAGPADGLNRGFARTTGELLYYVNADDVVLPQRLLAAAERLESWPTEVGILHGDALVIDGDGRPIGYHRATPYHPWLYANRGVTLSQPGTLMRRPAFEAAGGFNPENTLFWDAELFLEMKRRGVRHRRVDQLVGTYRLVDGTLTERLRRGEMRDRERLERERMARLLDPSHRQRRSAEVIGRLARHALRPAILVDRLVGHKPI